MVSRYLSLIKFSHTLFALPFAMIGFCLGVNSQHASFSITKLVLVLACMVLARSAAMAFNRFIDRRFDALNPRTAQREIPSGQISPGSALAMVIICSVGFVICCWLINSLCFWLSFVALAVILGYSYMKRFTPLCHLVLGVGLSLAPIGAYIALTEHFAPLPVLFSAVVFFWVSGFDIIYALQDDEFDRSQNLRSIPAWLGRERALWFSRALHLLAAAGVVAGYFLGHFGVLYLVGGALFIALLVFQQSLVKPTDLSRVTLAFATLNGVASVCFAVLVCFDLFVRFL